MQQIKRQLSRWCQVVVSASGCLQLQIPCVVEPEPLCWNVQVKSGQNQAQWEKAGWITAQDPRGWFQWYCRFYQVGLPASDHMPCLAWGCCVSQHAVWSLVSAVMVLLSIRCHQRDFVDHQQTVSNIEQ